MEIEVGKLYRTRAGQKARIYAIDGVHEGGAIHGATFSDGWSACEWCESGSFFQNEQNPRDLVCEWVDAQKTRKLTVYPSVMGYLQESRRLFGSMMFATEGEARSYYGETFLGLIKNLGVEIEVHENG